MPPLPVPLPELILDTVLEWARRGGRCVAADNIHVVAKHLLSSRVGVLAAARERDVKRALGYALDWAELKML